MEDVMDRNLEEVALSLAVQNLYNDYAACVDNTKFEQWPDFFTDDCRYRIVSRENFDSGSRMSTLSLDSKAMLLDRVYGMNDTILHVPYYQRHVISPPRLHSIEGNVIRSEANYVVLRSRTDYFSEVFNTGRYLDVIIKENDTLRFKERTCVFDGDLVPNSIIYPL